MTSKPKPDGEKRKSKKPWYSTANLTDKIRDSIGLKVPLDIPDEKLDGSKYILKYDAVWFFDDIEEAFYEHLKTEYNESPMDFIREFKEVNREMSDVEKIDITRRFVSEYIKPQAPNELNISGKARNKILQKLKEADQVSNETTWLLDCSVHELFVHIDKAMKKDLQIDSFPRFTDSKFWLDLLPKYKDDENVVDALTIFDTTEEKAFHREPSSRELMDEKLVLQFLNRGRDSPRKIEKTKKQRKTSKKKSFFQRKNTKKLDESIPIITPEGENSKSVPPPKPSKPAPNRPAVSSPNRKGRPFFASVIVKKKPEKKEILDPSKITSEKVSKLALLKNRKSNPTSSSENSPTVTPESTQSDTLKIEDVEDVKSNDELDTENFDNLRKKRINQKRRYRKETSDSKIKVMDENTRNWELRKYAWANFEVKKNEEEVAKKTVTSIDQFSQLEKSSNSVEFIKLSSRGLPEYKEEKEEEKEGVQELPSWYYSENAAALEKSDEGEENKNEEDVVETNEEDDEEDEDDDNDDLYEKYAEDDQATPIDREKANKYFEIAMNASKNKEYQKAIDYYDLAIEYDCELKEAYFNRGVLNYSCHRYFNAILDMVKVIKQDPNDGKAFSTRGRALKQIGQYQMAIDDFIISNSLEEIPSNFMLMGICYDKLNKKTEAIDSYSKFIDSGVALKNDHHNLVFVYCNRALNYYQKYQYEQALSDYTNALKYATNEDHLRQIKMQRAKCHSAYGNIQQANQDLLDSYTHVDYYNNGVHAINDKKYSKGYDNFTQAINLQPSEYDYYTARAMCSKNLGNPHDAIFDLKKTLEIEPKQKRPLQMLGKLYVQTRSFEKAIEVYTTMAEYYPKNETIYFERGNIYGDMKKSDEAIENYTTALELNPEMSICYFNRALIYFKSENYKKALIDYNKAIQYDDENPTIYVDRGLCYYYLGMNEKAVTDFRFCLQLDPENSRAKEVLKHFE
eukprot:gene11033-3739_t